MSVLGAGLRGLNIPQLEAVRQVDGPVLILAGAGTGKTRVITSRIAYMVAQDVPPEKILAVTFTNKAATEMRERAAGLVSRDQAGKVTISTFHSLCVRLLRRDIDRLGYKKNFGIYASNDQLGLVRKIIVRKAGKNADLDPRAALALIGKAKNMGIPVSDRGDTLIADVFHTYQEELKLLNAVDFDDLLILAVKILQEHGDVRAYWREVYHYIMVDEFQDTNRLQMQLLQHLTGSGNNVCVVGDDDQSIYGWRGAEITNILDFERFFPKPKVVKLEENYRCTMPILHLANSIIRHNRGRREKTLWSSKESDDRVRVIALPGAEEEAETIVSEILGANHNEGRPWEDFAVLFRTNAQSRLLEQTLRENEIPYRVVGGMSFFDRREIRDLISYIALLLNPADDLNLLRIINNPPRGIGKAAIEDVTQFSIQHQCSIWKALQNEEFLRLRATKTQNAIRKFIDLIKTYADSAHASTTDYGSLMQNLLKDIEYTDYLRRTCKTAEEANMREQNVREFIESLFEHRARHPRKGLQGFMDDIALMSDKDDDQDISQKKGVCLITLHAAKGLEFPVVYLVGLEEGILPHSRSVEEGSRDEERRLLYVGITRAMERLTLTWCSSRRRYGDKVPCRPSSFLKELDKTWLDEISYDDMANEPASQESAAGYFERMKAMLASGG